jgi:hypothetical protein
MKVNQMTTVLLLSMVVEGSQAQNIIDQTYGAGAGSFELGNFIENSDEFMALPPGSTAITGWTVSGPGDGIRWLGPASAKSIDLTLNSASSIFTFIPTTPGYLYRLGFDLFPVTEPSAFQLIVAGDWGGYLLLRVLE